MRFRQRKEAHNPGQLGRRLDCVLFDRYSQHRGPVRGLAGDPALCADACLFVKSFLGLGFMQSFLKGQVDRMPEGPSETARRAGQATLVGEVRNAAGQTVRARLRTPEGYALTALTAFDAAKRVAAGEVGAGFQTPGSAFGPDYILSFDGVTRDDLNS